jgi:hypothetical protein
VALMALESSEKCNAIHLYYQEMDSKHLTIIILALEAKIRLTQALEVHCAGSNCCAGEQRPECGFVALMAVESFEKYNDIHLCYQEMDLKHSRASILTLEEKI